MTTLLEIAAAIQDLPEAEVRELSTWLQRYLDERWDQQLVQDVEAGRLDHLIARAEADIAANQGMDLYEALTDFPPNQGREGDLDEFHDVLTLTNFPANRGRGLDEILSDE